MRVIHVTPFFAPAFNYGGPPRSVLALCQALSGHGLDVEVVTTTAGGDRELAPLTDASYDGVRVTYLPRAFPRRYFRAPDAAAVLAAKLAGADVMHIHGCWNLIDWTAARAAEAIGCPYVIAPRGMLSPWSMAHGHRWLKKAAYLALERPALRGAAAHHATSEAEAGELRALDLARPVAVIPNVVDPAPPVTPQALREFRERFGIAANDRVVLTVGRLHPKKGLEMLGEAVARVRRSHPDVRLLVVGAIDDGSYVRRLRGQLDTALRDRVTFTGELLGRDRAAAYASAAVFGLLSAAENFALVVAEAMAASLPVVVSRNLPWAAVERWRAGTTVERDPEAAAHALLAYLQDPRAARAAGTAGREAVKRHFSSSVIAARMADLYTQCRRQRRVA
jgi:glycosyltransferase involved in cell wall biosynthesis